MAAQDNEIYIGTVSYLLSDRDYLDFIRGGFNVNQLPLLTDAIASVQRSLDHLEARDMRHRGGSVANDRDAPESLRRYLPVEPFDFRLDNFSVQSVSFESGSVYAKMQIAATFSFIAYQGIADYKDVKEGFSEIRADVINIVNEAFGVAGAGRVDVPDPGEDASLRYYFVQPRRIEEDLLRRRMEPLQR